MSSQDLAIRCQVGSLQSAMVGVFISQELADVADQVFPFSSPPAAELFGKPEDIYQHVTGSLPFR